MSTAHRICLAALILGLVSEVQAGDIYRWVDEQGRTHLSDVVPERYRNSASRIDARQYELTPEQQREAAERTARERERASNTTEPATTVTPTQPTPEAPAPPLVKRPSEQVTKSTDCTTWWRLFRESQECFGPFHTVGGGLKPEAFDHCNEIPSPPIKCVPGRD